MISKLTKKVFIDGIIECLTGLRIGGNKSSLEIGGVDLNIIKNAGGVPYIPGSSLKGKMRSLLAKVNGWQDKDEDKELITDLFGGGGGKENKDKKIITRLFVRDAPLDVAAFKESFPDETKRDYQFSETKTENVIDRSTGKAQHPRTIERVPAGSKFKFSILLDVYEKDNLTDLLRNLQKAMQLLQYDYLGGHGSRGSGKVKLVITTASGKKFIDGNIDDIEQQDKKLLDDFVGQVNETIKETA